LHSSQISSLKLTVTTASPVSKCVFHNLAIRGGADSESDSESDFEYDDGDLSDDEEYFDGAVGDEGNEDSFKEATLVQRIMISWNKSAPLTKAFISLSVFITVVCQITNKNQWPAALQLDWKKATAGFQFWRFLTPFFHFGPLGVNYILTAQFVWTYMNDLEKIGCKEPHDFAIMCVIGGAALIALYGAMGWDPAGLGHNLACFLVYVWSRVHEGQSVLLFDFFEMKAVLMPWFFALQPMIMEGMIPYPDILGILIGHAYYYLKTKKLLVAPAFIKSIFQHPILKSKYLVFEEEFGGGGLADNELQ